MGMFKNFFLLCLLLLFFTQVSFGDLNKNADKSVNILTWWGYLDYPEINSIIEKQCHVKVSFDEYYSNTEFLRRWKNQKQNYDIVIFSDTIYDVIKNEVAVKNSPLWKQSLNYNPIVKKQYDQHHFPSNVTFFAHALTGFLWNPHVIDLTSNDSVYTMFKKAKNKLVVIIDDPVEARKLISLGYYEALYGDEKYRNFKDDLVPLTKGNFKKLVQDSSVYITNNYNRIYGSQSFAFSFTWSGEAVVDLKGSKENYQFLVHPKLSYVSSDLLANLNNRPEVVCAAKTLTSLKVMSLLQNDDYYFSPYVNDSEVTDPFFKNIYSQFKKELPRLSWIKSVPRSEFEALGRTWDVIKLNVNG